MSDELGMCLLRNMVKMAVKVLKFLEPQHIIYDFNVEFNADYEYVNEIYLFLFFLISARESSF